MLKDCVICFLIALPFVLFFLHYIYSCGYKSRDGEVDSLKEAVNKGKKKIKELEVERDVLVEKTKENYGVIIDGLKSKNKEEVKERERAEEKIGALERECDLIRGECGRAKAIIDAL